MPGYRTDVRAPAASAVTTSTNTVSVGLTVTGQAGKAIYVTHLATSYTDANSVIQLVKLFDGSTEIYRTGTLTGVALNFANPVKITDGANCVATTSVSVNTVSGHISLGYYIE